ncbi:DUF2975 domain-containing protein [Aeromonas schubertii]|uniref:DUF2975 domain-containing protein n=1 Tax=Aeromonas schubertii TaxID=652 RepID=UPI0010A945A7|nr:DUF2975 domain-containing protein [Aeromonas schubertii]QCG49084.1 DUF2975 domain-containing protein [Aeromonas schubertii]
MSQQRLIRTSQWIERILLLAMICTPLMTLLTQLDFPARLREVLEPFTPTAEVLATYQAALTTLPRALFTLANLAADAILMMALWQLYGLCQGYRRLELFSDAQIGRYRRLGFWICMLFVGDLLLPPLQQFFLTAWGPEVHFTLSLGSSDFRVLLVGIAVQALALVMGEAKRLADDQALTV